MAEGEVLAEMKRADAVASEVCAEH